MLDLRPEDITHKSYLNRLLIEIIDQPALSQNLAFKGDTCAGMFRVRYPSEPDKRNNLKVSASSLTVKVNKYQALYLPEIDRLMKCQTVETMFANKLVAITDRYDLHGTIAGRDIYDIHHFFIGGYSYNVAVIIERTGLEPGVYMEKLSDFIKKHVTQTTINQDLNTLLPIKQFQQIRKILLPETLALLEKEQQKYNR
jgi:hypothetical protein